MALTPTSLAERRRFARHRLPFRLAVHLSRAGRSIPTEGVNISEGGLCLRLRELLDVRSLVQLQLSPARPNNGKGRLVDATGSARWPRPVTCTGRVIWVIQRLDLQDTPPFVFDTGLEFVNPPTTLHRLLAPRGGGSATKREISHERMLEPSRIRRRQFVPRLERSSSRPPRWHLVVSVDGVPCFSAHYPSERAAIAAWARFKRHQAKR